LAAGIGQRAVSTGDRGAERGNVVVWDAVTGRHRFTLRGQHGAIYALAFTADDRLLVSGSRDGTIAYWNPANGKRMATSLGSASGGWLTLTEAGFYAGSDGSDAFIALVRGNIAVPAARVRAQLLRPDLVAQLLKGDPDGRYRDAARKLDLSAVLKSAPP
jgi:WD40 repeat protein